jgi:hypothetical protein
MGRVSGVEDGRTGQKSNGKSQMAKVEEQVKRQSAKGKWQKLKNKSKGKTQSAKRKTQGTSRLPESVVAAVLPFDLLFALSGGFAFCVLRFAF